MKKPNYSIGEKHKGAPNEKTTTHGTYHNERPHKDESPLGYDKNSRRADPANANRILTVAFGKGAEAGTHEHKVDHRQKSFYKNDFNKREPDMPRSLALAIAKEREATNLSNNFDYGHDAKGGAKAGKEPVDEGELKTCY